MMMKFKKYLFARSFARLLFIFGVCIALQGAWLHSANRAIHLPKNIPLTMVADERKNSLNFSVVDWNLTTPFLEAKTRAISPWRFVQTPKGEIKFEHPYIDASVTFTLFSSRLFFPRERSLDWQAMYLRGLGLQHLNATAQESALTFGSDRLNTLFSGQLIGVIDYQLSTLTDFEPLWCRDYFINFVHDKQAYCMRLHFVRKNKTPKTALKEVFKLINNFEVARERM